MRLLYIRCGYCPFTSAHRRGWFVLGSGWEPRNDSPSRPPR
ncbi:hypothetical protein EVA_06677 [gut metagenome]|uniref:Uncharacterized protein n=1 Tax=gut metagenome TaxID=749906 RepID=J9GE88_9ZZZZ